MSMGNQQGRAGLVSRSPDISLSLRDIVGNADIAETARTAMATVDAVQKTTSRGARLLGMATAFLIVSESAGLAVGDLMGMARNCMCRAQGTRPEFAAVEEFVKNEVL